ncbi:hypothetical protein NX059_011647 [Plenodomus lindquistii]|nr:hypothetical protein NX059_011647 [Plenodomus lindquistii]
MSWWRRDSSLAPTRLLALRVLRSHGATLRPRCFSRTPPQSGQNEEDRAGTRPAGMSNLEWIHIQHYKQWQKRFAEDPYNAIFGASNEMTAGKGLKDWEWVSKSFPKWMLREMDSLKEYMNVPSGEHNHKGLPKDQIPAGHRERSSHFLHPLLKTTRFDPHDMTGVASPSDLRRPREKPHIKVAGHSPTADIKAMDKDQAHKVHTVLTSTQQPLKDTDIDVAMALPMETTGKEASEREASFIEQFFATEPEQQSAPSVLQTRDSVWRQTTLQRRALRKLAPRKEPKPAIATPRSNEPYYALNLPRSRHSVPAEGIIRAELETASYPIKSSTSEPSTSQAKETNYQSTTRKLNQLPKDDIDFISADELRAAIRAKKRKYRSDQEKAAERKRLEHAFQATAEPSNVDIMIEAKAVNDQMIRRLKREMAEPEVPRQTIEASKKEHAANATIPDSSLVESSVERIKNWFEQGGSVFASHFWQDPTEEVDAMKTRVFFDKAVARIRKGRVALRQVVEDLETDLPASKPLLKRLRQDEELLDSAIQGLRTRSDEGKVQTLSPKKIRAIQTLRLKFQDIDRELEQAYLVLQEAITADAVAAATSAFKRRLVIASRITQQSAKLSRYLIWSIQARLEDPAISKNILGSYKAVANSLLTLRDTQTSLARLIDRALSGYKVEAPKAWEGVSISKGVGGEVPESSGSSRELLESKVSNAQIRADVVAEERLANEVDAQKTAMSGLSDDGYAHALKPIASKPIEEWPALAHSLFRPFGSVLANLTENTSAQALKVEEQAKNASHDANLVAEVRAAYEDTYGPVIVGHKQLTDATEVIKKESESEVKQFDKDDPISDFTQPDNDPRLEEAEVPSNATVPTIEAASVTKTDPAAVHTDESEQATSIASTCIAPVTPFSTATELHPSPRVQTNDNSTSVPEPSDLLTHYTILLYNAQSDSVIVSTSTSPAPRNVTPIIALPQALASLDTPAKFIPHIPDGLEIVAAKKDMLVLRDRLATFNGATPYPLKPTTTSVSRPKEAEAKASRQNVNPIDGTARLSPTGYVGPEESQEQLEKDFQERRQTAKKLTGAEAKALTNQRMLYRDRETSREKRRGAGSVVKTAIWAAATCYVFGVIGEIVSGA